MLDHIETGYEGKFDFPARVQGPGRTYLLASVPRAGSTYFSHLLWRTGCLGAPLEYLNFARGGPYGFAANSTAAQLQLWSSVLRRRCSPNGVFGLKAFPVQLEHLQGTNPPLLQDVLATLLPRDRPPRVIYLRRRDRVAHVVSYARAWLSGVWRKEQENAEAPPIEYSQQTLDEAERGIAYHESSWERMFDDLRIEPLLVWHEDVLADGSALAQQVAQYLGVEIDPGATVKVPEIHKQSAGDAQAWIERYEESRSRR